MHMHMQIQYIRLNRLCTIVMSLQEWFLDVLCLLFCSLSRWSYTALILRSGLWGGQSMTNSVLLSVFSTKVCFYCNGSVFGIIVLQENEAIAVKCFPDDITWGIKIWQCFGVFKIQLWQNPPTPLIKIQPQTRTESPPCFIGCTHSWLLMVRLSWLPLCTLTMIWTKNLTIRSITT